MRERYLWPVRVGLGGDPWVKADAVMPAVLSSAADILIVADADCWTDGLADAVAAVEDGAPWAIPHGAVLRLSRPGTDAFIDGEEITADHLQQRPYKGVMGGGFVVARRQTLIDIPLDPRFTGWGQEDESWADALTTLAGSRWRGSAPLYHLYHPPQERMSRAIGSDASAALRSRYAAAKDNPDAMRALTQEIHGHFANQQALHDSPQVSVRR